MNDAPRDNAGRRLGNWLWYGLLVLCVVLFAADALYQKYVRVTAEGWFGFYALYAFIGCVLLVFLAKGLRWLLARPEDYYDKDDD